MALSHEEMVACDKCFDGKKPICLNMNKLAHQHHHPLIRFEVESSVPYPCHFRASWEEIAPLLVGQLPEGNNSFQQSDLAATAYPDGFSQIRYRALQKDTINAIQAAGVSSNPRSPERIAYVMSEKCSDAVCKCFPAEQIKYQDCAVLYANNRDQRFRNWSDSLKSYSSYRGESFQLAPSKWVGDTYGGGGGSFVIGMSGGDFVLNDPGGKKVTIDYVGIGPCFGIRSFFDKIPSLLSNPSATGSPNRFQTKLTIYKNFSALGDSEPSAEDLSGFCAFISGGLAAAWGFGQSGPTLGAGVDYTTIIFNLENPKIVVLAHGKCSGFNDGVGAYFGYAWVDKKNGGGPFDRF